VLVFGGGNGNETTIKKVDISSWKNVMVDKQDKFLALKQTLSVNLDNLNSAVVTLNHSVAKIEDLPFILQLVSHLKRIYDLFVVS